MKKCILVLSILAGAALACAAADNEPVTLPELKAIGSWYHLAVVLSAAPDYPYELRRAGAERRVSLGLVADVQGPGKAVSVLDSDNHALSAAALAVPRRWKLVPVDPRSTVARRHARVTFNFVLEPTAGISAGVRPSGTSS